MATTQKDGESMNEFLIKLHLSAFVPLEIRELQQQGGPDEDQLTAASKLSHFIAEKGDAFQFGGKKGEASTYAARLTEALAIMAFIPGGVTAFGLHFEASIPESEAIG